MMVSDQSDKLMRAYARLRALRDNLSTDRYIELMYVEQYHEALQHLEENGFDVAEFRISPEHLKDITIGANKKRLHVERPLLLSKLDAVLTYFELAVQRPPAAIGFKAPSSKE